MRLVVGDGDPFHRDCELGGQCRAIPVPGRRGDDDVDVGKFERGLLEAAAGDLGAGGGELLVHRGRLAESKHVARIFESDCGTEVFTVVGDVHPVHTAESEVVVAPVAQQGRPDGGERKVLTHPAPRVGVARDDEGAVDGV